MLLLLTAMRGPVHDAEDVMFRRASYRTASLAVAVGSALLLATVALTRAASLCPHTTNALDCPWRVPLDGRIHEVGFSTTDSPCETAPWGYGIFVSSSATDHSVNQGPITDDTLYLWTGTWQSGYGFFQATTTFTGDLQVTQVSDPGSPMVFWEWTPPVLTWGHYWIPGFPFCWPEGTYFHILNLTVAENPVAVRPGTWGRMKALYH
jgi:hypothetical protein